MIFNLSNNKQLLYKPAQKWDFKFPPFDTEEFSLALCEFMWKEKALGVAAPQIGQPYSVFSMIGDPESFVCFNPRIVEVSQEVVELEEACLSYPGLVIEKTRPKHIRIRFAAPSGEVFTRNFTGMTARIIQHEMDHLNGVAFWDGISHLKFTNAIKKAKKIGFDYSEVPYKPSGLIIQP